MTSLRRVLPRAALSIVLATIVVARAGQASADDDPRKKAAESTFQEGVRLHQQGKNEEALAKLKQAYETYPSPNTLSGIARVEQALGRDLEALRHYREAIRNPLMHPENAERARASAKELEKHLARVDVKGPVGLSVTIDGARYVLPLVEPLDVRPDTMTIAGTLGDARYEGRATAIVGRTTEIEMKPVQAPGASGAAPAPPVANETKSYPVVIDESNATRNVVAGSLVAVGLVGLGLGVGFTAGANSASDDLARAKASAGPNADQACASVRTSECDARAQAADDLARNTNVARAMFIGGTVAVVGGVIAFFVWPKTKESRAPETSRIAPLIGSGFLGLSYGRNF